jgi:hypothetical protein
MEHAAQGSGARGRGKSFYARHVDFAKRGELIFINKNRRLSVVAVGRNLGTFRALSGYKGD